MLCECFNFWLPVPVVKRVYIVIYYVWKKLTDLYWKSLGHARVTYWLRQITALIHMHPTQYPVSQPLSWSLIMKWFKITIVIIVLFGSISDQTLKPVSNYCTVGGMEPNRIPVSRMWKMRNFNIYIIYICIQETSAFLWKIKIFLTQISLSLSLPLTLWWKTEPVSACPRVEKST